MLGLKEKAEEIKKKIVPSKDADTIERTDDQNETFSAQLIRPKRTFYFGRRLSFSINDNSIQMAAVAHWGKKKRILDVRKVYIPLDLRSPEEKADFLSGLIQEFVDRYAQIGSRVTLAISGRETAFRTVCIPMLKGNDLDAAIKYEVTRQIPFHEEENIYDYRALFRAGAGNTDRYKVALYATIKRYVEENLKPFRLKKIEVSAVHYNYDVVGYLLTHLADFEDNNHYSVINIDRNYTEISFYHGMMLEFFHISPIGTSFLAQEGNEASFEEFAEQLSSEIQTSLDYYTGQYPESLTERIYVYGDLTYSEELLDKLNTNTGIAFERFPVEKLDFVSSKDEAFLEILPVCLPALAAATCDVRLGDCLPEEDRLRRKKRKVDLIGRLSLVVLLLGLITSWFFLKQDTMIIQNKLLTLTRQVEEFKNSNMYGTYNILKRKITTYQAYLERAKKEPSYFHLNLKELSLITPPAVRLYDVEYRPVDSSANLTLQGLVTSNDIPPEVILAEYVENLNASPFFENVNLVRYDKKQVGEGFEMEFQIMMKGIV